MPNKYVLGFISHSLSSGERRVPMWIDHLTSNLLNHPLIEGYIFEENFGSSAFHKSADARLIELGCKVVDRLSVLRQSDIVISLKPQDEWLYMKPGSTLLGWFSHLDNIPEQTSGVRLLSFEDILINVEGRQQKLLYKNAFAAGECGVNQTLEILGKLDPLSPAIADNQKLAVVLGYGNLGQGAVSELIRQGIEKVIVFTQRPPSQIENKLPGVDYRQMIYSPDNTYAFDRPGLMSPLITNILHDADIIVNSTLPSLKQPRWTFVPTNDFDKLKPGMAYIDPVHQAGHGINFAHTTTLPQAVKKISNLGHSIWYNGCNAMPSYRPAHASFVISQAIMNHLDDLLHAVENNLEILL